MENKMNEAIYGMCGLCQTEFNEEGYCLIGHKCSVTKCQDCHGLIKNGRCINGCKQRLDRCTPKRCNKYLLFGKCSMGHDNTRCHTCDNYLRNGVCHSHKCPENICPKNKCKNFSRRGYKGCKGIFNFKTGELSCKHTNQKCNFCDGFMLKSFTRCDQGHNITGDRCQVLGCNALLENGMCSSSLYSHTCICGECILPLDYFPYKGKRNRCPGFDKRYCGDKCIKCNVKFEYACPNYNHYFYRNCDEVCFSKDPEEPPNTFKRYRDPKKDFCPVGHNGSLCNSKVLCLISDNSEAGEHNRKYQNVSCGMELAKRCGTDLLYGVCPNESAHVYVHRCNFNVRECFICKTSQASSHDCKYRNVKCGVKFVPDKSKKCPNTNAHTKIHPIDVLLDDKMTYENELAVEEIMCGYEINLEREEILAVMRKVLFCEEYRDSDSRTKKIILRTMLDNNVSMFVALIRAILQGFEIKKLLDFLQYDCDTNDYVFGGYGRTYKILLNYHDYDVNKLPNLENQSERQDVVNYRNEKYGGKMTKAAKKN